MKMTEPFSSQEGRSNNQEGFDWSGGLCAWISMVGRRQPEHVSACPFLPPFLIRRLARGEWCLYALLPGKSFYCSGRTMGRSQFPSWQPVLIIFAFP